MLPPLITTPDALALAVADLRRAGRFALDTESNSLYAYHYRVCLIQAASDSADYLIDTLALPDQSLLHELVAEPGIEVTMHAAENDTLLLHRDFGFRFHRLFDTLWAARILGWRQAGLAAILQDLFGVQLDKRMQRTDWGRRPLTPDQIAYARLDTHYLLPLRDRLEAELKARGRWAEAEEAFAGLTAIVWEGKEAPSFWRLPGAWDLEPRQQAVLKALFDWREAAASRRDIPPFKVMGNEVLITLAKTQPATLSELRSTPGLPRYLPEAIARTLRAMIEDAQTHPTPAPPERNHTRRPDADTLTRYDRLRAWRTRTAEQRGVDPDVVLTNQALMAIARLNPLDLSALAAAALLGAWKLDAYGPAIVQALR